MMPPGDARGLVGVLFDLDDTVLSHGVLTREAYDAIWSMHEAGLRLVAVTGGRAAGARSSRGNGPSTVR